ncbi:uncharacterized protein B0I36DRAFT_359312 [Microdochium trichocladiopsis]|uniref:Elongator complex protein 6 n=1 Tax=Microdochium trichocladiopsis TaxID=1682393 RepID=A0A9P8YGP1_9PEZI|nr:uncharacterized protein B0I36DRAFT_359312 [Microdochium trichocladiopsis]KAH7037644.1 hypothetical protein B0I36DRAFT_359312 [Microdochium trichocladiopsis]
MATRIPHLLEPYLCLPPESSLTLLTGVLGASTNWLVLRYLYSLLANTPHTNLHSHGPSSSSDPTGSGTEPVRVVFLSFLRDYAFWKDNAARLGIDLDSASAKARFVYVDGLTNLFSGGDGGAAAAAAASSSLSAPLGRISGSGSARLTLNEPTAAALRDVLELAVGQRPQPTTSRPAAGGGDGGGDAVAGPAQVKTVLVVDQMDLLVAASGDASLQSGLADALLDIREKVYSTIITLSADEPLIQAQNTPLEKRHASLVLSTAHTADLVISVRLLDTGSARDVSGVLRVTAGGSGGGDAGEPEPDERELLYHIGGDGAARVFERGQ